MNPYVNSLLIVFYQMKKGNSIQQFLIKCLEQLRKDFSELRTAGRNFLLLLREI